MCHTLKNLAHFKKSGTLGKCAALKKMRKTSINAPHVDKCASLKKMQHTWKNMPHLEKYGTLGKMRHT